MYDLDGPASARPDQGLCAGNGISGFSPERKRNHTGQSIGSNSTTINFISPTLISNAMVAFSNLNGNHTQNGHGGDYHRSLSLGAPDRKDAPLQHHPLKEDRRRAITEPHLMPHLSKNGKAKGKLCAFKVTFVLCQCLIKNYRSWDYRTRNGKYPTTIYGCLQRF